MVRVKPQGAIRRSYTSEAGFTAEFVQVRAFLKRIYCPGYTYGTWLWNR